MQWGLYQTRYGYVVAAPLQDAPMMLVWQPETVRFAEEWYESPLVLCEPLADWPREPLQQNAAALRDPLGRLLFYYALYAAALQLEAQYLTGVAARAELDRGLQRVRAGWQTALQQLHRAAAPEPSE